MKKIMMLALFITAAPLSAIEIPLAEFGKTTSVAYLDIHRVFEAYPETEKARIALNQLIAQKKDDITAKKEEIAALKTQIEFLKKQMNAVVPSTAPKTGPAQAPAAPVTPDVKSSTGGPEPLTHLTLPETSPLKFLFTPPEGSTATAEDAGRVKFSTFSKSAPEILPGIPSPGPSLSEKEIELLKKQSDLEIFIGTAQQEVQQMEEGKTMTVMARIYKALEDISNKEGYAVIVDKENILYGDKTIDITENVIYRLNAMKFRNE